MKGLKEVILSAMIGVTGQAVAQDLDVWSSGTLDSSVVGPEVTIEPGDRIKYRFGFRNNTANTIHNISVDDSLVDEVDCGVHANPIPAIGVGRNATCTGTHIVTQDDLDRGFVEGTTIFESDETTPIQEMHRKSLVQVTQDELEKTEDRMEELMKKFSAEAPNTDHPTTVILYPTPFGYRAVGMINQENKNDVDVPGSEEVVRRLLVDIGVREERSIPTQLPRQVVELTRNLHGSLPLAGSQVVQDQTGARIEARTGNDYGLIRLFFDDVEINNCYAEHANGITRSSHGVLPYNELDELFDDGSFEGYTDIDYAILETLSQVAGGKYLTLDGQGGVLAKSSLMVLYKGLGYNDPNETRYRIMSIPLDIEGNPTHGKMIARAIIGWERDTGRILDEARTNETPLRVMENGLSNLFQDSIYVRPPTSYPEQFSRLVQDGGRGVGTGAEGNFLNLGVLVDGTPLRYLPPE